MRIEEIQWIKLAERYDTKSAIEIYHFFVFLRYRLFRENDE